MYSNTVLFSVKPSQWTNCGWILMGVVGMPFFPLLLVVSLYKILEVYCLRFDFCENTIKIRKGVFKVVCDEISYYRIKSLRVEEPFLYRIVGLCNMHIISSDPHVGRYTFIGLHKRIIMNEDVSALIQKKRTNNMIQEVDLYSFN